MKVLVCGGAGYIGSHIVRELVREAKYEVVVLDNLSKGHQAAIPTQVQFERGDIRNHEDLDRVFGKHKPQAVFHFCAWIEVGESMADPLKYYENNVAGTVSLLQAMQRHGAKYFIFSSTAAVFGKPKRIPVQADDPKGPINPYGHTKLIVETLLDGCETAFGLKYVCLRYFNACGADAAGDLGEDHEPESHLVPIVLQVPLGKREKVYIFGDDYDTDDGTCVRDYVHVTDLATAHIKSLEYIMKHNKSDHFNLGSGQGYSVKQIIEAARKVTGHPIPAEIKERYFGSYYRRPGDPDRLIAASDKAEKVLGWSRKYTSIEDIVRSAWNFHRTHPNGYGDRAT